ncbi:Peptidase S1A, chymotrypsin-type [Penicillium italicum]|uniref:Peptidase S1A, chymotrypsin-type n=1 Tax=Penicillium italicum TaxID=40296 RepID=A0A0A2KWH5_PENIT|nr:Peptidase S1A, chymotrypsin-type [Penicillium italicum]
MKYFLAHFFALAAASPGPSIVGGSEVSIEDFPYQIALLYGGSLNCGGSIISHNHVVTAAHCVSTASASELGIRAGSSFCDSGGSVVNISSIAIHPKYDTVTFDNDIAILTLAESITYGPRIAPLGIPYNGSGLPSNGEEVVVSGWGAVHEGGAPSPTLRAANVSMINMKECKARFRNWKPITDSMFCAGVPEGGRDSCDGDSGGPAVANGILIGVVSWGNGCARREYPGVYSNTAYLRGFIGQITGL